METYEKRHCWTMDQIRLLKKKRSTTKYRHSPWFKKQEDTTSLSPQCKKTKTLMVLHLPIISCWLAVWFSCGAGSSTCITYQLCDWTSLVVYHKTEDSSETIKISFQCGKCALCVESHRFERNYLIRWSLMRHFPCFKVVIKISFISTAQSNLRKCVAGRFIHTFESSSCPNPWFKQNS